MSEESATAGATPPRQGCFMMHAEYVQHHFSWYDIEQLCFWSLQMLKLVHRLKIVLANMGSTAQHRMHLLQCLEASQQLESKQQWESDPQVEQGNVAPGQDNICQHPKISTQNSSEPSNYPPCCHGLLYVCANSTCHQHALLACCVDLCSNMCTAGQLFLQSCMIACSAAITSVSETVPSTDALSCLLVPTLPSQGNLAFDDEHCCHSVCKGF